MSLTHLRGSSARSFASSREWHRKGAQREFVVTGTRSWVLAQAFLRDPAVMFWLLGLSAVVSRCVLSAGRKSAWYRSVSVALFLLV